MSRWRINLQDFGVGKPQYQANIPYKDMDYNKDFPDFTAQTGQAWPNPCLSNQSRLDSAVERGILTISDNIEALQLVPMFC
jgi:hypothetical protein